MARFFPGVLFLLYLFLLPMTHAGNEIILVGGTRAAIEGKQLILIDRAARRSVAPPGRYDTRDGKFSIVVNGNGIVLRDHTKELR